MAGYIEGQRLAEFSSAVRGSTLKRLHAVPSGCENWRSRPEAMSFAELAQHLIDCDRWLFRKIQDASLEPVTGGVRLAADQTADQFRRLCQTLDDLGQQRAELLASLSDVALERVLPDRRFGGEVSLWWIIVRGNLDHEIHHRGQIAAYLPLANSLCRPQLVVTKSRLVADLRQLGVSAGQTVMLHASVKAIGWVVGGPDVVLGALLDVLTPAGTLMMYVGWEEGPYDMAGWSEERKQAYRAECPPFDPRTSRAHRPWSILTEYLRTRPGACRSANPEASCAAIGAKAAWLAADHPMNYGYGPGSPLEKLCQAGGKVLLLGAPLNTVTLLHYSECLAEVPDKRIVHYSEPILRDGKTVWVDVEEFDTNGIRPNPGEYFNNIMKNYITSGQRASGIVGAAQSYLFDAADLATFAARWMERNLGSGGEH